MTHKLKNLSEFTSNYYTYLVLLFSWISMLGSLYYSEVLGITPCTLCWYQRALMYPIAITTFILIIANKKLNEKLVLPVSLLGMIIAAYHYALQKADWNEAASCSPAIPCGAENVNYFGFITIPFLALIGFSLITLVSIIKLAYSHWK